MAMKWATEPQEEEEEEQEDKKKCTREGNINPYPANVENMVSS